MSFDEAQAGNIVMKLIHNGFYSVLGHMSRRKCKIEQEDGFQAQDFKDNILLPPTLRGVSTHTNQKDKDKCCE